MSSGSLQLAPDKPTAKVDTPTAGRRRAPRTRGGRRSRHLFDLFMVLPALLMVAVFGLYPMFDTIRLSFLDYDIFRVNFAGTPFVWFDNYAKILTEPEFLQTALNTATFGVVVTVAIIVLGLAVAPALNRKVFGTGLLRGVALMPWFVPGIVASAIWLWMFSPGQSPINQILMELGWVDAPIRFLGETATWGPFSVPLLSIAVARIWGGLPLAVTLILAGLQSIDSAVYDASKMDGANRRQTFFNITLPMLRPTLLILTALLLIGTVGHFELVYLMTGGGPANLTNVLAVYSYEGAFVDGQYGIAAAASTIILVISGIIGAVYMVIDRRNRENNS
ncbi:MULTISPECIES: sugar ABC transporter permease [unclassified Diaminobutyricimonas]|uniref:carbohydrate ABC transporter permease n=1 Tax=unclassified Diaminobutyricimonas TaxID=2643261 RepID=UPI0012F4BEC5|nr:MULTISPECIES: sugar ABC transporter permease [unclassified Diaminobutyricimonas]